MNANLRFWLKVYPRGDCWEWRGYRSPDGYGRFLWEGKVRMASRMAYEFTVGPIPAGLTIDHLCRHPWCVRPSHLEVVTTYENFGKRGLHSRKRTCPCGRPYDLNRIWNKKGKRRVCSVCEREYHRGWRAEHPHYEKIRRARKAAET